MSTPSEAVVAPISRFFRRGQVVLVLALLALYLPTLASGPTFSDGPELVTAIWTLGVPHPTGYPLFVLLAHAFTRLLPIPVSPCVKVELFNVFCALGAAILTARSVREVTVLLQHRRHVEAHAGAGSGIFEGELAGLVVGFLLGVSHLVWEQVRIPEVYPLHLLLVTWAGRLWVRFEVTRREGYIVAAALPMGLGLAHHVTMVYFLPAAAIYLLLRRPGIFVAWLVWPVAQIARRWRPGLAAWPALRGAWAFPVACLVGALPMLSYYYLIWANAHTTGIPWNDVSDWERLVYHVSGKQYSGFFGGGDLASWWNRIRKVPGNFDRQFLPAGTAMLVAGLMVVFRRAGKLGALLLALMLFNVGHGIYYSVGDYLNYYIPALYPCAVFMGAGLWWILRAARARPAAARRWMALSAVAIMALAGAATVAGYASLTKRMPPSLTQEKGLWLAVPLGVLGVAAGVAAVIVRRRRDEAEGRALPAMTLPAVLLGGLAATFVPVSIARAARIGGHVEVGGNYGAEVVETVPRGAVYLTQGDGYLFNMWYQHHVLDQGLDFATLDVGTLHAAWYQRYLRGRYPVGCDPLAKANLADKEDYGARCGTFAKRMALGEGKSWLSFGQTRPRGPRGSRRNAPEPEVKQAREGENGDGTPSGEEAQPEDTPAKDTPARDALPTVVRGSEPRCDEPEFRKQNGEACKCWNAGRRRGAVEETCVLSAEEGGVVPRAKVEIHIDRIIRRHIDERPVYERNAMTNWVGEAKTNPRGWNGPAYQRISGEFALVNRGRVNQVMYAADLSKSEGCAETLNRVTPRAPRGPGPEPAFQPYQPNEFPTLLSASYLSASSEGTDDDARRRYATGETIYARLQWFEQFHHDASSADRRGKPLRHGVRICVYDPSGARIASAVTVSGRNDALELLRTSDASPRGRYTVQACSVGDVGEGEVTDGARCQRVILEYPFLVGAEEHLGAKGGEELVP
ncbi:glycosyltransferase family 117 protein [Chondromyces crocatus]|nr:DUF2723 domain-containing protein [Chondromyces crocatus]